MSIGDWIILAVLAVLVVFAVRYAIKHRGSCSGNCQHCQKNCTIKEPPTEEEE